MVLGLSLLGADLLFIKHHSRIFRQSYNPVCVVHGRAKLNFGVGQTAQSLTFSIMEKSLTGLDDYLRMLLSCFKKRRSG